MFLKTKTGNYINTAAIVKMCVDTDLTNEYVVIAYTVDKRRFTIPWEGTPTTERTTAEEALEEIIRGIQNG